MWGSWLLKPSFVECSFHVNVFPLISWWYSVYKLSTTMIIFKSSKTILIMNNAACICRCAVELWKAFECRTNHKSITGCFYVTPSRAPLVCTLDNHFARSNRHNYMHATMSQKQVLLSQSEDRGSIENTLRYPLWRWIYVSLLHKTHKNTTGHGSLRLQRGMNAVTCSVAVLAEISLRSPRKIFICITKKIIYRIKVSKN